MRARHTAAPLAAVAVLVATLVAGCTGDRSADDHEAPPPGPASLAPANLAFVDVETTRTVSEQITPAVARFFSYDHRLLDEYMSQTMADTTPRYWTEVEPSLTIVRDVASRRQVVASAEVVATSVGVLEPSRAELLLFVNRRTTEAGGPPQQEGSSVVVKAARTGPNWKIDGMTVS